MYLPGIEPLLSRNEQPHVTLLLLAGSPHLSKEAYAIILLFICFCVPQPTHRLKAKRVEQEDIVFARQKPNKHFTPVKKNMRTIRSPFKCDDVCFLCGSCRIEYTICSERKSGDQYFT
jgi:hypothetical protein